MANSVVTTGGGNDKVKIDQITDLRVEKVRQLLYATKIAKGKLLPYLHEKAARKIEDLGANLQNENSIRTT